MTAKAALVHRPKGHLFGPCGIAWDRAEGKLTGVQTQSSEEWHAACSGIVVSPRSNGRDRVNRCECDCGHPGGYRCAKCGQTLQLGRVGAAELGTIDPATGYCADAAVCGELSKQRADASALRRTLRECVEAGAEIRANDKRRKMPKDTAEGGTQEGADQAAPADKPARVKRTPKAKTGACHHCGEQTKGGLFVAGHDAKLKGDLQRLAVNTDLGDQARVDAIAEQLARGWHKSPVPVAVYRGAKATANEGESASDAASRAKLEAEQAYADLRERAQARVSQDGADAVIAKAVKERTGVEVTTAA